MTEKNNNSIGTLNGKFENLFKFALITYPVILTCLMTWGTWVTVNIITNDGRVERLEEKADASVSRSDAELIKATTLAVADTKLAGTIQSVNDRITGINRDITEIKISVATLASESRSRSRGNE